jgi:ribonuclease T1
MFRFKALRSVFAGLAITGLVFSGSVLAKGADPTGGISAITVAELPAQGKQIYALIHRGGPFAYEKDGTVFGNRERLLPLEKRGFYHEYTVSTPGAKNRGAKRIVCGGQAKAAPEICYYTADHYASFRKIVP